MKPARTLTHCLLFAALSGCVFVVSGCESWHLFGTPPEKVANKQQAVAESDKAVVADGQAEIAGAQSAATELPAGRAKDVTLDFLNRGADLIAQGNGPLDPARAIKMRDIALGRLSEEVAKRDAAEKALYKERGRADETVAENGRLKGELQELQGKLAVSWATEHATAEKWRGMWFWIWCAAGLYGASIILPIVANIFAGGAAGPILGLASKAVGFIAAPAIQFAKDRATTGLAQIGHALEDFRQDAPALAARITRKFDSHTDTDAQRVVGAAARHYRENIRPLEIRAEKTQQDAKAVAA